MSNNTKDKKKMILSINKEGNPNCTNNKNICPLVEGIEGVNRRRFNFLCQIIYSIITISIIGNNTTEGKNFFIQLTLFSTPLFLEYMSYNSQNVCNNIIYIFQKLVFGISTTIGLIGIFSDTLKVIIKDNITYIEVSKSFSFFKEREFDSKWIIFALGISVLCIFVHVYSLKNKIEEKFYYELQAKNN